MEEEIAIFAASLVAVAALVALAHRLGFSGTRSLADEDEAREALALVPGGFALESLVLDAEGRGALARDGAGRMAVVIPHGGRLVARLLGSQARLTRDGDTLVVTAPELGARDLRVSPRDGLPDWACSSRAAS